MYVHEVRRDEFSFVLVLHTAMNVNMYLNANKQVRVI